MLGTCGASGGTTTKASAFSNEVRMRLKEPAGKNGGGGEVELRVLFEFSE